MAVTIAGAPGLGLVLPPSVPPGQLWPAVETADRGGFDSVWVTDRTIAGTPWLEAHTLLGAVAARTERVRIGTSVLCIARRNPVLTAHALATADHLSGGRLVAGVGLGGLEPAEYAIAGVPIASRGALTDEYLGLVRRLWQEESVDHHGPGFRCEGISIAPRPAAPVPLWIGGNSPAAYRRAGRLGDGWISVFAGPDGFRDGWEQVLAQAEAAGRDPQPLTPAVHLFAAIGTRPGQAEAVLEPAVRALLGAGLDQYGDACLYGTPDRWTDTIGRFAEAGARQINVLLFGDGLARDTETIALEVIPQLGPRTATPA
ncbi:LLM class flavin-dependent oxidoreductase [Streptomyces albipurpureus]|uniref:TIGR03619 family F420-dependent LLM class oxidoreductase n=1 Tax=Streptomyces albipurpureus TaxID=2897419 RepID=A0ABT0UZ47_9ACTN|nr:TIGR03619 family F420-dependent LLM class oxidoreductase [Streptomyces sp. CWNU-1]MCM2393722.1 TIGR03619 family F420-dependent LLM class oxidoreductase [Streptomyces sp. CWNU-1]